MGCFFVCYTIVNIIFNVPQKVCLFTPAATLQPHAPTIRDSEKSIFLCGRLAYSCFFQYLCSRFRLGDTPFLAMFSGDAAMVESVDTRDLKSLDQKWLCGFKSHSRYYAGELLSGSFLFFRRQLYSLCRTMERECVPCIQRAEVRTLLVSKVQN